MAMAERWDPKESTSPFKAFEEGKGDSEEVGDLLRVVHWARHSLGVVTWCGGGERVVSGTRTALTNFVRRKASFGFTFICYGVASCRLVSLRGIDGQSPPPRRGEAP